MVCRSPLRCSCCTNSSVGYHALTHAVGAAATATRANQSAQGGHGTYMRLPCCAVVRYANRRVVPQVEWSRVVGIARSRSMLTGWLVDWCSIGKNGRCYKAELSIKVGCELSGSVIHRSDCCLFACCWQICGPCCCCFVFICRSIKNRQQDKVGQQSLCFVDTPSCTDSFGGLWLARDYRTQAAENARWKSTCDRLGLVRMPRDLSPAPAIHTSPD